ncbi:MAG: hypothetical protein JOS17DRAFT_794203 [Linnemannia elongata]|nr:MAG: hypothetical protein JOS17DRAFT_794203 [Linnemannia elongata]
MGAIAFFLDGLQIMSGGNGGKWPGHCSAMEIHDWRICASSAHDPDFSTTASLSFSPGNWNQIATDNGNTAIRWSPSPDLDQEVLPLDDQDCVSVIEGFAGPVVDAFWRPNRLEFVTSTASGAVLNDVIGLSAMNRRLLEQRDATRLASSNYNIGKFIVLRIAIAFY